MAPAPIRRLIVAVALGAVLAVAMVGLVDGLWTLLLARPHLLQPHPRLLNIVRNQYDYHDRNLIHADPRFARYDPELLYTLRPGAFIFENREFRNAFHVNSLGLRDDEASLVQPEVIVLGDSFAMGWGVEQHETFAELIAAATGLRVLNAGMSSYGTLRQTLMLNRLDTSRLRYLVIQYAGNDSAENEAFAKAGNRHVPSVEAVYQRAVTRVQAARPYYVGKWTARSLVVLGDIIGSRLYRLAGAVAATEQKPDEAGFFLNALQAAGSRNLSRVQILVLEVNEYGERRSDLIAGLRSKRDHSLVLLDFYPRLRPEHFYLLDVHLNAGGHRVIADGLVAAIRSAAP